ncbi:MAG: carbon-nitrogen hydrolase family protein [Pseudomonadota bacterium]
MMTQYKAAAVQAAPVFLDLQASTDKACALIKEAAGNGAKLIGFPETFLPGYPFWIWLGPPAWGMQFVGRYFDNAITLDSPQLVQLQRACRDGEIAAVIGMNYREHGTLYIAQAIIGPDGTLHTIRRKLKPTHAERTVFGDGDGSDMVVLDMPVGKLGALNCWEHLQPLNRQLLIGQHEQVHVASWPGFGLYREQAYALGPEVNEAATITYAAEAQAYVVASTLVITDDVHQVLGSDDMQRSLLQLGGGQAMIYGPDGRPLAEKLAGDQEGLVYADIDLSMIAYAKAAGDPAGHYARPDVAYVVFDPSRRDVLTDQARAPIAAPPPADQAAE